MRVEGIQRILARPTVEKAPITPTMLEDVVKDTKKSSSLSDLKLATVCLLAYASFLHFNELVNIRPCDISIHDDKMILHLPRSKTDQLHKRDEVIIDR